MRLALRKAARWLSFRRLSAGEGIPNAPFDLAEQGRGAAPCCARRAPKATPKMLGHLCTTWVGAKEFCRALLDELPPEKAERKPDAKVKRQRGSGDIVASLKACMEELTTS